MADMPELEAERAYTMKVQGMLLALIERSRQLAGSHDESIRMIMADAWEELRLRPTAISPEELQQLAGEIDRFTARRRFADGMADRAHRMLMEPFFGRVDFLEKGEDGTPRRIVIGLYSLPDEKGELLVHDWRAPICSLYYDSMPGEASYESPSGRISGTMTLKRQYRMENGRLLFYVDTGLSIDDGMLLDILSGATSRHMRQIVSTIQAKQNAAIRCDDARVVSVVGSAGSGKTSVAMHRAAFLMYRRRNVLDANRLQILSPSTAFSEYISTVLPELGEDNIRARTLHELVERILGRKAEPPARQTDRLLSDPDEVRRRSVAWKCGPDFMRRLRQAADDFARRGPDFRDVLLDGKVMIRSSELSGMYRQEFRLLSPAQRLERMRATLETRMASWSENLMKQYRQSFSSSYGGKDLEFVSRMAVSQRLQPIRLQLREVMEVSGDRLLDRILSEAPGGLAAAWEENRRSGLIWWEDAVAEAYLMVRLGFAEPDKSIWHLLVDEAQDYSDTAMALLHAYHPNARVTLLGDPMQRTCPSMPPCVPENWGGCFGAESAPLYRLSRCYRSTLPIARLCNALLTGGDRIDPIGREGEKPLVAPYSIDLLRSTLDGFRARGHRSIAVITRTQAQADSLSARLDHVYRLDGGEADLNYESSDNVVSCFHLTKGMEFDAVIVVWPDCELTGGERRRLYTACSRALHEVALLGGGRLIRELAIEP